MNSAKRHTGLCHLYWGDGKGKTTAAMGLALRALGSGLRATVVPFLKAAAASWNRCGTWGQTYIPARRA